MVDQKVTTISNILRQPWTEIMCYFRISSLDIIYHKMYVCIDVLKVEMVILCWTHLYINFHTHIFTQSLFRKITRRQQLNFGSEYILWKGNYARFSFSHLVSTNMKIPFWIYIWWMGQQCTWWKFPWAFLIMKLFKSQNMLYIRIHTYISIEIGR